MKKKPSKIWLMNSEELQNLIDTSSSYSDILRKLKFNARTGGAYKTLIQRIREENLNCDALKNNKTTLNRKKIPLSSILSENSDYSRTHLKKRLIKENLLEYICSECGLTDLWNNKPLSLQLDHINGINNDNRLENLRFLCPNCHSQTENYAGKSNKKIPTNFCIDCNVEINKYCNSIRCKSCSSRHNNSKRKKFEISKDELINLIKQYPMIKVGKLLGVSDNAVRKRCKALGIDYKNL